ncbi:MAG: hypothetical protein RR426_09340, partial [Oscillospiraceae bacterium]
FGHRCGDVCAHGARVNVFWTKMNSVQNGLHFISPRCGEMRTRDAWSVGHGVRKVFAQLFSKSWRNLFSMLS